jgi:hypothetical protein
MPVNEQEIMDFLTESVRHSLEIAGMEVLGQIEVQVYQRWDRRNADIVIKAKVAPKV